MQRSDKECKLSIRVVQSGAKSITLILMIKGRKNRVARLSITVFLGIVFSFVSAFFFEGTNASAAITYKWENQNRITASGSPLVGKVTLIYNKNSNIPAGNGIAADDGYFATNVRFNADVNGAKVPCIISNLTLVTNRGAFSPGGSPSRGNVLQYQQPTTVHGGNRCPGFNQVPIGNVNIRQTQSSQGQQSNAGRLTDLHNAICQAASNPPSAAKCNAAGKREIRNNVNKLKQAIEQMCKPDNPQGLCLDYYEEFNPEALNSSESGGEAEVSCQGGVLGWILCPFVKVMTDVIREVAGIIDGLMQYRLLATAESEANSGGGQGSLQSNVNPSDIMRAAWQNFLNIANILLVIAFLAIIFSQATSVGISNYGIKRMLPRLIAGAILMNLSFYICAFAVDLTNILGNSILGVMQGMSNISGDPSIQGAMDQLSGPSGLRQGFAVGILAVAAAVAVAVIGLLPVLFGILVVLIVLAVRQVVLTVLILVSPIAFVAWLLPNTEQYFKKWWSLFSTMLLAYPIVMLVFGAAMFVASLLQAVNRVGGDTSGTAIGGLVDALLPLIILTVPLFILPKIITSTNSILGKVYSGAHGFINQAGGEKLKKAEGDARNRMLKNAGTSARTRMLNNEWADKSGFRGRLGRGARGITRRSARREFNDQNREEELKRAKEGYLADYAIGKGDDLPSHVTARALATQAKRAKEEIDNESIHLKRLGSIQNATGDSKVNAIADELMSAARSGNTARAAAAQQLLLEQGTGGHEKLRELSDTISTASADDISSETKRSLASNLNESRAQVEDKTPELLRFIDSNGTEGASMADSNQLGKMTAEKLPKLSDASFSRLVDAGHIDNGLLRTAERTPDVYAALTPKQKEVIRTKLGRRP